MIFFQRNKKLLSHNSNQRKINQWKQRDLIKILLIVQKVIKIINLVILVNLIHNFYLKHQQNL